jgi:hypothetical protein
VQKRRGGSVPSLCSCIKGHSNGRRGDGRKGGCGSSCYTTKRLKSSILLNIVTNKNGGSEGDDRGERLQ